jgi:cell division protein FtsQ
VVRRTTVALARPLPLRVRLPTPARGVVLWTAGTLAVFLLAYVAARASSVFAVDRLEVRGAAGQVRVEVERAAAWTLGESLVGLDGDELVRRLELLPFVRSASYDRAFPNTLRITVVPERPLLRVLQGKTGWLVSEQGRVMRRFGARKGRSYARLRLARTEPLALGETLTEPAVLFALAALSRLPAEFPAPVRAAHVDGGRITLVVRDGMELRLGGLLDIELKLAVAARVLDSLTHDEWASLAYVDVSLPERPVAGSNPQVEG